MFYKSYFNTVENRTYVPVEMDDGDVMIYWVWWPRIDDVYRSFRISTEMEYYYADDL